MPRNLSLICRFIFTSVLLGAIFSPAAIAAPTFSLQGRILKPGGGVLEVAGVQFDIRVLSPDASSCILYEETQTKDLTGSGGLFNISLNDGSGTRSDGLPHAFEKTFSNQAVFNVPSAKCGSGAGTVTYTPGASDERTVLIYFKEPGAAAWEQMPAMTLSHSSFAYEAGDSLKVGGFGSNNLLRVVDGSGNPAAATAFNATQFSELLSVSNGNYTKTSANGSIGVPVVSGNPGTGLAAGQMWYDSAAGQLKYYDGAVKTVGTSGGSVTSVAAGTGLTGGPITTTGTLAVDVGTAAGKIVQVQTGGKLPTLDGSNLTNVTATSITGMTLNDGNIWIGNGSNVVSAVTPNGDATMTNLGAVTVNKIKGTTVSANPTAAGQVLKYNGTTAYAPGFIGVVDIRSTVAGNAQFIPTNCTASQTLVWQAPTDVMACTAISVTGSNFASQAQNTVLAGPSSGGAGAPSFRTIAPTDLPLTGANGIYANGGNSFGSAATIGTNDTNSFAIKTNSAARITVDTAGNVGIGTPTPAGTLDIQGGTAAASTNATNVSVIAQSAGTGNQNGGSIVLRPGAKTGTGSNGAVLIGTNSLPYPSFQADSLYVAGFIQSGNDIAIPSNRGFDFGAGSAQVVGSGTGNTTDYVDLTTNSVSRLRVDGFGNVGVGTITPVAKLQVGAAPTASANYPLFALGTGAFNGSTAGFFTGNANGTFVGVNAAAGYTGDFANFQTGGVSKFKVDTNGNITSAGSTTSSGNYSTSGNISTTGTGTMTSAGALTVSAGGANVTGGVNNNSGGISNAGSITGVGANLTGAGAMTVAAGGAAQNLTLSSSTSGSVNLGSGNGTSLSVLDGGASTVNYVTMKGSATGAAPVLGTAGSDANINLVLAPKGNGNVGIGTATPADKLTVSGKISGGTNSSVHYNTLDLSSNNGANADILFQLDASSSPSSLIVSKQNIVGTGDTFFQAQPNATGYGVLETWAGQGTVIGTGNATPIIFRPNRAEVMRIQSSGNVGIGTASPGTALDIGGGSSYINTDVGLRLFSAADKVVQVRSATQSVLSLLSDVDTSGAVLGGVYFGRTGGQSDNHVNTGGIRGLQNGTGVTAGMDLAFLTKSGSQPAERMRIDRNGYVGIGTTTPLSMLNVSGTSAGAPLTALTVQNTSNLSGSGAGINFIADTGYVGASINVNRDSQAGPRHSLRFSVNGSPATGTNAMNIMDTGNVGIGTTTPASKLHVGAAPTASANYGLLSLGSGAFDGTTAGFFTGNTNGTVIATNAASGYTGDLANLQIGGSSKFKVDSTGNIVTVGTTSSSGNYSTAGNISTTGAGTISSAGGLTVNSGGANVTGGITNNSGGIVGAGNITGVGANLTGAGAMTVAAGGTAQNLTLSSSTSGSVNLGSGNGTSLSVLDGGASTVNYLTMKGSATGAAPVLGVAGSDANIHLLLAPKGTGNVGIGTTNPFSTFHVRTAGQESATFDTSGTNNYVTWRIAGGSYGYIGSAGSTMTTGSLTDLGIRSQNQLLFATNGNTEKMRIDASGNVGVGTTTPGVTTTGGYTTTAAATKFDVAGEINSLGVNVFNNIGYGTAIDRKLLEYHIPQNARDVGINTGWSVRAQSAAAGANVVNMGFYPGNSTAYNANNNASLDQLAGNPTLLLTGAGNVGIGTNAPAGKLSVYDTIVGNHLFEVRNASANGGAFTTIGAYTPSYFNEWRVYQSGSSQIQTNAPFLDIRANNGYLTFDTANTEKMRIATSGSVGIGTTSPIATLDVVGSRRISTGVTALTTLSGGALSTDTTFNVGSTAAYPSSGILWVYDGTGAISEVVSYTGKTANTFTGLTRGLYGTAASALGNGNTVDFVADVVAADTASAPKIFISSGHGTSYGGLPNQFVPNGGLSVGLVRSNANVLLNNNNSVTWNTSSVGIKGYAPNTASDTLQLYTNGATRMHFDGSGNVGIGNTSPAKLLHVGSAAVGTGLAVANFQNVDGTCTITPASSGSGIACSSDERLKENFQDVTGSFALDRILQLQAVTYNFKTSTAGNRRTGYRAQDVQKVAPEFVRQSEDGLLQVYYDAFIPWITEAIKTLHSNVTGVKAHQASQDRQIASIEAREAAKDEKIKRLEQENAAMKARLDKIEKLLGSR